jgi:hypothetical protein
MPKTTVVHVHDTFDVYIGRAVPRRGFQGSPWANPFPIGEEHNRRGVINHFRNWVTTSDDPRAVYIREHVGELRGKRLGCWCAPKECHGQVLAELADFEEVPGA